MIRTPPQPPQGITISGPMSEGKRGMGSEVTFYVLVGVYLVGPLVTELAKETVKAIAVDAAKKWLIEFFAKHKAKRISINGREAKDQESLERLISDEIDIGKND